MDTVRDENIHEETEVLLMKEIENIKALKEWLLGTEQFYIYGAGKYARKLLEEIERSGTLHKVKAIFVTNLAGNEKSLHGVEVLQYDENIIRVDIPIILALSEQYRKEIYSRIIKTGNPCLIVSEYFNHTLDEVTLCLKQEMWKQIVDFSLEKKECGLETDILFISPPYWDVYSPFSAVPALIAKLKDAGFIAEQYDVGIHCVHHLIDTKWKKAAEYCLSRIFYEKNIKEYQKNTYKTYEDYCDDMWFFKSDKYDSSIVKKRYVSLNAVQKRVIDAFNIYIYSDDIIDIDFDKCQNIQNAVAEWNSLNLLETLGTESLKPLVQRIPAVVGISVTSTHQFIPGCVLADLIRACRSDVKIIMGGSCADIFVKSSYQKKTDIKTYFDYIVVGEGETAIVKLMQYIKYGGKLEEIPNMVFIDSDIGIKYSEQIVEDVEKLPVPDYSGLDLELYLAPELVLPYQTSRGCHYGQCAFCNHDEKYRHNYRTKRMTKVIRELLQLSQEYHTQCFQFVDEAIRPDCFRNMIEEMDKHLEFKDFKWIYYSRVSRQYDEELLTKAKKNGCEMVMFGVESFNQRLLNFIRKGISAETSKYCLELFHKNGIKTYAWLMCNLPSETLEEAREDLETVKKIKNYIDAFSVGPFCLNRNTDMYTQPEKFNIIEINEEDGLRFQSHYNGNIIDKESMLNFYEMEYAKYQHRCFAAGNRYTLFFEE